MTSKMILIISDNAPDACEHCNLSGLDLTKNDDDEWICEDCSYTERLEQ